MENELFPTGDIATEFLPRLRLALQNKQVGLCFWVRLESRRSFGRWLAVGTAGETDREDVPFDFVDGKDCLLLSANLPGHVQAGGRFREIQNDVFHAIFSRHLADSDPFHDQLIRRIEMNFIRKTLFRDSHTG